ncbi:penicillin-binding transpeptidase domain-containing protein [Paenibacillus agricola]|jgi:cell division protein FtsI/penicillin-binding protein 2|uniref:Penicillin-binding transpeptidase domain-containing protein n=1 Tax=Paenibacillus agricola TaxID=2716264 RepID=A0ABX0JM68_9BACL|nr:penicillin-binding transpeptidase domain-containing protein [Paenibacillus agricola]NHN35486.1 penicillin-binding transpeptidase domain-containing protein [Paenibacillus agricola]
MKKLVLIGLFLLIVCGCRNEQPVPKAMTSEQVFDSYLAAWQEGQYEAMYTMLSTDSKTRLSQEQFVKRYSSIYEGIGMDQLHIEKAAIPAPSKSIPLSADQAAYAYHASLLTLAGPIDFTNQATLTKENPDSDWRVAWNPSLIFPAMRDNDKVTVRISKAMRGEIYDRNGQGLAINDTVNILGLAAERLGADAEKTIQAVAQYLGLTSEDVNKKLKASWVKPGNFVPIGPADSKGVMAFQYMEGVTFQPKRIRAYPLGEAAAHLTGYVQGINAEELAKLKGLGYGTDDQLGKAGLEQLFEKSLKGQDGARIVIIDENGATRETLALKDMVPGENVQTTIDSELQWAIYEQYQGDAGTASALQPQSGEILALVSSPAYDPNLFVTGVSAEQWTKWNSDPGIPLLNRFTKLYAPGSIFKTVTAAVGLNAGISSPDTIRNIQGLYWTKDASWGNYYVTRDRDVASENLRDALVHSDNIFFAQEALAMGKDTFYKGAYKFGFGELLPLPYPFPRSSLANQGINSDIQLADSAYGQGEVQMSPLHVALAYTPIINQGDVVAPVLVKAASNPTDTIWKRDVIRPEIAEIVRQDLVEAVRNPKGFAHGAYIAGMNIAGKTGTAELKKKKGEDGLENGWFIEFDASRRQLMLTMMVEDVKKRGGSGYVVAKAKKVFLKYGKKTW